MKKLVAGTVAAVALIAAAPANAQSVDNEGCGDLFRNLAAPGFGQSVAEVAKEGGFDEMVRLICNKGP